MSLEKKYDVAVYEKEKPFTLAKEITESLKGALSGKMIARMKREAIDCPVFKKELPFLQCFLCESHIRRYTGVVHCAGEQPSLLQKIGSSP